MKERLFKDEIHGFTTKCGSEKIAWALIRNKCHDLKLQVPTLDQIVEIKNS